MKVQYLIPILFVAIMIVPTLGHAAWWNTSYSYCQNLNITYGAAEVNYAHPINLTYNSNMSFVDMQDVRFINATCGNDGSVQPMWKETGVNSSYSYIWINWSSLSNGVKEYSVYYGNPTAPSAWDINNTFIFGDDFDSYSGTPDGNRWAKLGSANANVTNGNLIQNDSATVVKTVYSVPTFNVSQYTNGLDMESSLKQANSGVYYDASCFGFGLYGGGSGQRNFLGIFKNYDVYNAAILKYYFIGADGTTRDLGGFKYFTPAEQYTRLKIEWISAASGNISLTNPSNGTASRATTKAPSVPVNISFGSTEFTNPTQYWINYSMDWVFVKKRYAVAEATYALGSVQQQAGTGSITISFTSPANTTLTNVSITTSWYAYGEGATYNATAWLDGAVIYNDSAYVNGTAITNISNLTAGTHNLSVYAYNDTVNTTSDRIFTLTHPIYVDIVFPSNSTYYYSPIGLAYNASSPSYTGINITTYLNGTLINSNTSYTGGTLLNSSLTASATTYNLTVYANVSGDTSNYTSVMFTVRAGINISAYLPNGTIMPTNFSISATNASTTISHTYNMSSPQFLNYYDIPLGSVNITAEAPGYDQDTVWSIDVNSSMSVLEHNFTLYPYSFIYFYDSTNAAYLTNWLLNMTAPNGTMMHNSSSVATYQNQSNRGLVNGTYSFGAALAGYDVASTTWAVINSTSFNITLNTSGTTLVFGALDEITRTPKPFNAFVNLIGTNITQYYMTAYRNGYGYRLDTTTANDGSCYFDSDMTTACLATKAVKGTGTFTVNGSTIQAFDYNNATFLLAWGIQPTTGNGTANLKIYLNDTDLIYNTNLSYTTLDTTNTATTYITINNSATGYPKALNITFNISTDCTEGAGGTYVIANISEFRLINNTAGYTYYTSNQTDYRISYPSINTVNFTTHDVYFQGEEVYASSYSDKRMYRLTFSPYANYSHTAYLLTHAAGFAQYFTILDGNNNPLENALVTMQRWYSGTAVTIAQCASNAAGSCSIFLQASNPYQMIVSKSGYTAKSSIAQTYTGSPNPANIYLSTSGTSNFTSVFQNLLINMTPSYYYTNASTNVTCTLVSGLGTINWINLTAWKTNSSMVEVINVSSYSAAMPTGGTLSVLLNATVNATDRYRIRCSYEWVSNATGTSVTYTNFNEKTLMISVNLDYNSTDGLIDKTTSTILALGLIMIICGIVAMYGGRTFSAIIGILLMLMLTWYGFMDWGVATLGILTSIAVIFLRGGI